MPAIPSLTNVENPPAATSGFSNSLAAQAKGLTDNALGPRVTGEVLAHLGAKHGIQTSVEQTVEHFAELDPEARDSTA